MKSGWERGSAILVFTCPPDYCSWRFLPPIPFRYLRRFTYMFVCLLEKGFLLTVCILLDVMYKIGVAQKECKYRLCDRTTSGFY